MAETKEVTNTEAVSKTAWKKAAVHTITLPSGAVIDIKVPDLPNMIKTGEIPNPLIDTVLKVVQGSQKVTAELVGQQVEFTRLIVPMTVVSPTITADDLNDIPVEDQEMVVEIATRQRDLDALGHQIGGLHKIEDFRTFRGLPSSLEDLSDL